MRNFVLVTATCTKQNGNTTQGAGLKKLKRGVTLDAFAHDHMASIGVLLRAGGVHVFERDTTLTVINRTKDAVITYSFTSFPEEELFTAVAHLTKDELMRDLKELLPLKDPR